MINTMIHWNYMLALENDINNVAKYIEFNEDNYNCYSIELAHLLLSTASEVDVVAKALIVKIDRSCSVESNINFYRKVIKPAIPNLSKLKILIPRYSLGFEPWSSWDNDVNPLWWKAYNDVKHERNNSFHQATLENTLNTFSGLLSLLLYYYKDQVEKGDMVPLTLFKPDLEGVLTKSQINPGMTAVRYKFL